VIISAVGVTIANKCTAKDIACFEACEVRNKRLEEELEAIKSTMPIFKQKWKQE
jgi:hypothetical protein